jgi:hypothetical protein
MLGACAQGSTIWARLDQSETYRLLDIDFELIN